MVCMCAKGSRSWRISAECDNQRSYTREYPTSNIVDIRLSGRQHVPGYALALSLMFRHLAVVAAKRCVDELAIIFYLGSHNCPTGTVQVWCFIRPYSAVNRETWSSANGGFLGQQIMINSPLLVVYGTSGENLLSFIGSHWLS